MKYVVLGQDRKTSHLVPTSQYFNVQVAAIDPLRDLTDLLSGEKCHLFCHNATSEGHL